MRRRRWSVAYACLLLCAACVGPSANFPALPADEVAAERRRQEIAQMRDYYAQLHRLDTVAFRIRTANSADCKGWVTGHLGLLAATPRSLPRKYHSFSAEALGLRWARAAVISVVEGSPAAAAGIVKGDELMTFNNELVPVTGTSRWIGDFQLANGDRPVRIVLKREGEDRTVDVKPAIGCAIPVNLAISADANAFTDYSKIVIHSGILRIARTDDQLAVVVGHELAHVNMGHYGKKLQNAVLGALGGVLIDGGFALGTMNTGGTFTKYFYQVGARAFSPEFEREADYVGAYYATRAGYDLAGAEEIWAAMGMEDPNSIRKTTTHPTSPVRFLQMRKVAEEIADKKRRNQPLVPEMKRVEVDAAPATREEIN
ncbi:MAG: M48 family metalloprotease [Rhizobiales bacterium]|nr:M48 family metalloprotease [Hyphomicrobiales bacterium]